jgi:ELWxxDGT repeat protein
MTKPATFLPPRALTKSFLAITTAVVVVLSSMQFSAVAAVDSAPKVILNVFDTTQSTYQTSRVRDTTEVGDKLFFVRDHLSDGVGTAELWVSNGAAAGTTLLKQIQRNDDLDDSLAAAGELLYFFQAFTEVSGDASRVRYELWKSDGSSSGTVKLSDFGALGCEPEDWSKCFEPSRLVGTSTRLFVQFTNGWNDKQVWTSDGTSLGTVEVESPAIDLSGSEAVVGGTLYFEGTDERLWKTTDGTDAGTTAVATTSTSVGRDGVGEIEVVGDWIYYGFDLGTSIDLWRSNGTVGPGERVSNSNLSPEYLTAVGESLYFVNARNGRLWVDNGGSGLQIFDPENEIQNLTAVGNSLFFTVGEDAQQLWISGGTEASTIMLLDEEYLENLTAVKETLFFAPFESKNLWSSDGTIGGTSQVAVEIDDSTISDIVSAGGILYFTAATAGVKKLWSFNLNTQAPPRGGSYSSPELTIASPRSKVVRFADFSGNSSFLSKKARAGLTKAIKKFTAVNAVVCTGYSSGVRANASQRKLALARARAACKIAKKLAPDAVVKLQAAAAKGTGPKFRAVRVKITGN